MVTSWQACVRAPTSRSRWRLCEQSCTAVGCPVAASTHARMHVSEAGHRHLHARLPDATRAPLSAARGTGSALPCAASRRQQTAAGCAARWRRVGQHPARQSSARGGRWRCGQSARRSATPLTLHQGGRVGGQVSGRRRALLPRHPLLPGAHLRQGVRAAAAAPTLTVLVRRSDQTLSSTSSCRARPSAAPAPVFCQQQQQQTGGGASRSGGGGGGK